MHALTKLIDFIFAFGLFYNVTLFAPQAKKIWKSKSAEHLSKTTFIGFCFGQLSAVVYGYLHQDMILALGSLSSLTICGFVTAQIFYYQGRNVYAN